MVWKHIAALAALILISFPAAAFNDGPTQQTQGITFFVAIPLDARHVKEESLYSGLAIQGKRAHENVRIDSRLFNDTRTVNFFGTRDKATTAAYQQQAAQQQQQQQNGGGGGTAPCPVTPTCP
jgi:hypothetical protein